MAVYQIMFLIFLNSNESGYFSDFYKLKLKFRCHNISQKTVAPSIMHLDKLQMGCLEKIRSRNLLFVYIRFTIDGTGVFRFLYCNVNLNYML